MDWWQNLIILKYSHKVHTQGEQIQCIHKETSEYSNKATYSILVPDICDVIWIHIAHNIHKFTLQIEPDIFIIRHIFI